MYTHVQTYHYNLDTGMYHDPLRVRYSHHVRRGFDFDAMQPAANLLEGTHDFTQFSNDSLERLRRNPVKTLQRFRVMHLAPDHIRLEVRVCVAVAGFEQTYVCVCVCCESYDKPADSLPLIGRSYQLTSTIEGA